MLKNLRPCEKIAQADTRVSRPILEALRSGKRFGVMMNVSGVAVERAGKGKTHHQVLNGKADLTGSVAGTTLAMLMMRIPVGFVSGHEENHMVDLVEDPVRARLTKLGSLSDMANLATYPLNGGKSRTFDDRGELDLTDTTSLQMLSIPDEHREILIDLYMKTINVLVTRGFIKPYRVDLRHRPGATVKRVVFFPELEDRGSQFTWVGFNPQARDLTLAIVQDLLRKSMSYEYRPMVPNLDQVRGKYHHWLAGHHSVDITAATEADAVRHFKERFDLDFVVFLGNQSTFESRWKPEFADLGLPQGIDLRGKNLQVRQVSDTLVLALDEDQSTVYPGRFPCKPEEMPKNLIKAGLKGLRGPEQAYAWHLWLIYSFLQGKNHGQTVSSQLQAQLNFAARAGGLVPQLKAWGIQNIG